MNPANKITKLATVSNCSKSNKETILSLASKLQNNNMKDEKTIKEVINDICNLTGKQITKEKEEIVFCLDAIQDPLSLQEPVYNDGSESIYIMDQVKDNKNTDEYWAENITILEAMKKFKKSNNDKNFASHNMILFCVLDLFLRV